MLKDLELGLPSKLPSKKDDLFCFSFNFENLIKTIDYLHKYNLALFSKLQNFNERMIKVEEIAVQFPKVQEEIQNLQLYSREQEKMIKENQSKINDNDTKINDLSKKIDKNKISINKNEELINNNKEKIDLLFKEKEKEKNDNQIKEQEKRLQNENQINNKKEKEAINFDEIKKYINENVFKGNNDKDIELLKHNVNTINDKLKEMQINIDSSNNQMERNISNLINSLENNGGEGFQINIPGKSADGNLFKMTMAQIEKNKKYSQDMIDQISTSLEKLRHDVNWLNNDLFECKNNYQNLQKLFDEYLEDKKFYLTFKDIKQMSKNVDILHSKIKEYSLKTDLESFKTDFNVKFQKIAAKLKELDELKNLKNKKEKEEKDGGWDPEDLNFVPVTKRISELISDLLKSEGKNIDLTKNKHFIELMKLNQQNSSELNKNMKNYLNLKTLISSSLSSSDIEELKKEINDFKNDYRIYKNKLVDLIQLIGGSDLNNSEDKYIEEEKMFDNKLKQSEQTIKGKIEFITEYLEDLSNKLMKAEKKLNSLTKDLKDDMKANLRLDTFKVVEQFKLKLNSFTDKFENELKNKIDKMGLNVFENKLNSKLNLDLKDKLNKNDLKKNNFMINKKLDTLENKISKTLVDTIIDLQMDDAPLLMKKNNRNVELCASCNRPLNDNNLCSKTIEPNTNHTTTSPNFVITPKTKIKNIASLKKLPAISSPPK